MNIIELAREAGVLEGMSNAPDVQAYVVAIRQLKETE